MMGFELKGLAELLERPSVHGTSTRMRRRGFPGSRGHSHERSDHARARRQVAVGDIEIELLHTPGHTPGSQRFLLTDDWSPGDTLFLEGCGRTDFPGGNVDEMFRSLQQLASLAGDPTCFRGTGIRSNQREPVPRSSAATTCTARPTCSSGALLMGG